MVLRELLERCAYLPLARCWFLLRMQLDQAVSSELDQALKVASDPHKATLTRVILSRHILANVLARPPAAPLLGKLVCLLEV